MHLFINYMTLFYRMLHVFIYIYIMLYIHIHHSQLLGVSVICAPKQVHLTIRRCLVLPGLDNLTAGAVTSWIMGYTPNSWPHLNGENDGNP